MGHVYERYDMDSMPDTPLVWLCVCVALWLKQAVTERRSSMEGATGAWNGQHGK